MTNPFTQCEQCWQPATCKKHGCRHEELKPATDSLQQQWACLTCSAKFPVGEVVIPAGHLACDPWPCPRCGKSTLAVADGAVREKGHQMLIETELREALEAQLDASVRLMREAKFSAQQISDCTSQARRVLALPLGGAQADAKRYSDLAGQFGSELMGAQEVLRKIMGQAHAGAMLGGDNAYQACLIIESMVAAAFRHQGRSEPLTTARR